MPAPTAPVTRGPDPRSPRRLTATVRIPIRAARSELRRAPKNVQY